MNLNFIAETPVDLHNDAKFEKLASFGAEGLLDSDDLSADIGALLEKQSYAEDSTYADPINRMFSIASPLETKISALYAQKCASVLDRDVVLRLNDACKIYNLDLEVPVVDKVASITDDKEIMDAIDVFDREYIDPEADVSQLNKYASCTEYGNQLDTCLAARAYYATEAEDVEAIENLAKIASSIEPAKMVDLLIEIDSELGLDTPNMQKLVGTPEYAVYEKVASNTMVNLGSASVPLAVIDEYSDQISDMGVELDWDGEDENSLALQIESLPSQVKDEIASWCGKKA